MAWMRMEQAGSALRMSQRTIRRRVEAGELESKRDGRCVLVDVPEDKAVANVTEVGRRLSEVAASSAIQSKAAQETHADMIRLCDKIVDRACEVERRAAVAIRWMVGTTASVCIGAVVLLLVRVDQEQARTDRHHAETVVHVAENARLKAELGHARQAVTEADQRAAEAVEAHNQVLDAHLAGFGFQVADAGR